MYIYLNQTIDYTSLLYAKNLKYISMHLLYLKAYIVVYIWLYECLNFKWCSWCIIYGVESQY